MLVPVVLFVLGLILLIKGGDWFVDGAVGLARRFHIPEIIIGATIVSIGTTLPEVMVSAAGALRGQGSMAYGNAIGSIICNASLIAAITLAVRPGSVDVASLKMPVLFFFLSAAIYTANAYITGYFSRPLGFLLLAIFAVYMVVTIRKALHRSAPAPREDEGSSPKSLWQEILLLVVGAVIIAVGANLLINNGTLIAQALDIPESVIALTFIALGTSLPECITAITSLVKGHSALSLGNVIGANLFNLVLVSGISMLLAPFEVPVSNTLFGANASLVLDIPVMLGSMALLTVPPLLCKKRFRWQGILLLCIFAAFCAIQFT